MTSCEDCDRAFMNENALRQHLRDSPAHAVAYGCDECDRAFTSERALQQHMRDSPTHAAAYDCDECNRAFDSEEALRQHLRDSPKHPPSRNTSRHSHVVRSHGDHQQHPLAAIQPRPTIVNSVYKGVSPALVKAVYRVALRLRRQSPSVDSITCLSGTSLDASIVRALWNAAERLNSLDESPEQARLRAELQKRRSQWAQVAEDSFVQCIKSYGYQIIRESQIRSQAAEDGLPLTSTPDMICNPPILIGDKLCGWLEYKDYFGFPDNPFVAASEKRQLRKYVQQRGPGAVVYALGYQTRYPNIEGVAVFRAADVLIALRVVDQNALIAPAAVSTRAVST